MSTHTQRVSCVLILLLTLGARHAIAQDSQASVRELYASASYEDVLSMLDRLDNATPSASRVELERYRILSLIALGRATEASQVIERMIGEDPLYVPDEADTPPRVRAAFRDVRRRTLPDIAKRKYANAKVTFDRKGYATAAAELEQVIRLIDDPDVGESAQLGDLRLLAAGFLDLSTAAMAPQPAATPSPAAASDAAAVQPPAGPVLPASAGTVVPPVPLHEKLPSWVPSGSQISGLRYTGLVRITIDERGNVESAVVVKSIHPQYNARLLEAARSWKYRPAEQDGRPIRYVKLLQVNLEP